MLPASFGFVIDSDANTSRERFPLYKFAGSQGLHLVCFRQVPIGSDMSVSKSYIQLGYFVFTATDGLRSSGITAGKGRVIVIMVFAQPL